MPNFLLLRALPIAAMAAALSWPSATDAPSPDHVASAGRMHLRRFDHSATLLPDGSVLLAGGMAANGSYEASTELYDPATGRFTAGPDMDAPRACHAAVLLSSGRVLIAGGSSDNGQRLRSAALYDPTTRRFSPTGSLTTARCGAAPVVLPDQRILLIGGIGPASEYDRLTSAEIYDPATGRFTATGSMSVPRDAHTAVLLTTGKVLVVGGASSGRFPNEVIESSAELYDPASGRFRPAGHMGTARYKLGAVELADGRALIVGGSDNRAWRGEYATAELYDPATDRFSPTGSMSFKRYKLPAGVVRLSDGRVLVAGGAARPETYDPRTGTFQVVGGAAVEGFCFSTATLLSNGEVLIAGGYGDDPGAGAFASAWLFRSAGEPTIERSLVRPRPAHAW